MSLISGSSFGWAAQPDAKTASNSTTLLASIVRQVDRTSGLHRFLLVVANSGHHGDAMPPIAFPCATASPKGGLPNGSAVAQASSRTPATAARHAAPTFYS